ncbi:50S ribosomal protein L32 [Candidatus Uhrbacteria bacterium CG10_big_fil_rev_8_21_14_0_10_48_16]|uniref:Large ribosomal subunit protein bL32 n=1 Tax=Candidatus Uhrbacteria bacterium CG10_big_fil_rev_8_21_14_0_10_48_16 TaxID=1975038 RepID=A0A2M8LHX3_9BACT|nr:MAG: 50S ribosomal protein L32 [Candidatus Uhrbacteria bacterium CG10_big_fil_rev_8_21_14_0_10_48_16]
MSVPASKKSRSSVRRRRSHHALKAQNIGVCQTCQAPLVSHTACTNCGVYKGKQVLDVSRNATRAMKRAQQNVSETHNHTHEEKHDSKETEEKAS